MSSNDTFEFLGVSFSPEEAQLILEASGYTDFASEWGRGRGGFSELKLCCCHPEGRRMFAEYAWKQEKDSMVKRLLLDGLGKKGALEPGTSS
jgi:hypothetical protein